MYLTSYILIPFSIFMFEINLFKVATLKLRFTKGSLTFKILLKYDFFPPNIKHFYFFKLQMSMMIQYVIWFECLKILTHKKI